MLDQWKTILIQEVLGHMHRNNQRKRETLGMSGNECISEKKVESQWMGFRALVERLTSTVTGGNITEMKANYLGFSI